MSDPISPNCSHRYQLFAKSNLMLEPDRRQGRAPVAGGLGISFYGSLPTEVCLIPLGDHPRSIPLPRARAEPRSQGRCFYLCSQNLTRAPVTALEVVSEKDMALRQGNCLYIPGMPSWLGLGDPDRGSRSPEVSREGLVTSHSYSISRFRVEPATSLG